MSGTAWRPATLALLAALLAASVDRSSAISRPWFQQMGMKLHGVQLQDFLTRPRSADGRQEEDTRASFRADVERMAATRLREESSVKYSKQRFGVSTSVLWQATDWERYLSINRYWRYLCNWPFSKTAAITAPVVGASTAWAAVVCLAKSFGCEWTMPLAPLTIVSSAVVLLLTLRTNQSINRMLDARGAWGKVKNDSRMIAGNLATRVLPINPSAALLGGRLLCSVGWSLRAAMLGNKVDKEALEMLLPPEEAAWVGKQRKPALAALDRLSFILRAVADDPEYSERLYTHTHTHTHTEREREREIDQPCYHISHDHAHTRTHTHRSRAP